MENKVDIKVDLLIMTDMEMRETGRCTEKERHREK